MSRLLPLLAVLLLSGCGTLINLTNSGDSEELLGSRGPHIYGGVRIDFFKFHEPEESMWFSFHKLYAVDLILFSLPLDTALLPFTIVWAIVGPD